MRYQFADDGHMSEQEDSYLLKCYNFRDPSGPPLGSARQQFLSIGVTKRYVARAMGQRNLFLLGRIFGILRVELPRITSAHKGLKRPMRVGQDSHADAGKFVVVMHPTADCQLTFLDDGTTAIQETDPIGAQVFVALLTPNAEPERPPGADYWLEHCCWVDADKEVSRYPAGYMERYERPCIWVGPG